MNQAVISCLHANLPAVEAVLKDIELQGITNITCLGDLVGYGPQPNEVIELILSLLKREVILLINGLLIN